MNARPFPIVVGLLAATALTWYGIFAFLQPANAAENATWSMIWPDTSPTANPLDATTYYLKPMNSMALSTTSGYGDYLPPSVPFSANRICAWISFYQSQGTGETFDLKLRKNDATDYVFYAGAQLNTAKKRFYGCVDAPIAAGDYLEIKFTTPTWATNPTNVYYGYGIYAYTAYPTDAEGYLKNNGVGTLSWTSPPSVTVIDSTTDNIAYFMNEHFTLAMTGIALFVMFVIGLWA